jgi:hypothetical protein
MYRNSMESSSAWDALMEVAKEQVYSYDFYLRQRSNARERVVKAAAKLEESATDSSKTAAKQYMAMARRF